jgi:hypothetical protein
MQETELPPDAGFVVDWQMSDDRPVLIDLSTADSEVVLPADASIPPYVRSTEPARR